MTHKGGALSEAFLDQQNARGKALLQDWKQGGHGWLSDKVRQDRTPDGGQQEGTREIVQHIRMWEGRYTPRDSKQEFNMDQQITNQDEMQRERATPTEVDQRNQEDTGVIREHVRM